jgi:hypothetical protein
MPSPLKNSDVIKVCVKASTVNSVFAEDLRGILKSHNVIIKTYSNLRKLQLNNFYSQKFNVLAVDLNWNNITKLALIDIGDILLLIQKIESILKKIANFAKTTVSPLTLSSEKFIVATLGK